MAVLHLALVHAGHRGVVAMKNCGRSYFWWPQIDKQIEEKCTAVRLVSRRSEDLPKFPCPVGPKPQNHGTRFMLTSLGQ